MATSGHKHISQWHSYAKDQNKGMSIITNKSMTKINNLMSNAIEREKKSINMDINTDTTNNSQYSDLPPIVPTVPSSIPSIPSVPSSIPSVPSVPSSIPSVPSSIPSLPTSPLPSIAPTAVPPPTPPTPATTAQHVTTSTVPFAPQYQYPVQYQPVAYAQQPQYMQYTPQYQQLQQYYMTPQQHQTQYIMQPVPIRSTTIQPPVPYPTQYVMQAVPTAYASVHAATAPGPTRHAPY